MRCTISRASYTQKAALFLLHAPLVTLWRSPEEPDADVLDVLGAELDEEEYKEDPTVGGEAPVDREQEGIHT